MVRDETSGACLSDVVLRTLVEKRRALTSYEIAWLIDDREFTLGTQGGRPPKFRYPAAQVAAALRNLARQGLVVIERDGYTRLYHAAEKARDAYTRLYHATERAS